MKQMKLDENHVMGGAEANEEDRKVREEIIKYDSAYLSLSKWSIVIVQILVYSAVTVVYTPGYLPFEVPLIAKYITIPLYAVFTAAMFYLIYKDNSKKHL